MHLHVHVVFFPVIWLSLLALIMAKIQKQDLTKNLGRKSADRINLMADLLNNHEKQIENLKKEHKSEINFYEKMLAEERRQAYFYNYNFQLCESKLGDDREDTL